ncbi:hypothetical protein [Burkholderia pseudomallei]|uniref:hypothetical protein n=1 Tax=Burkholderia pseudomallei TaxID=28450 RepID=UPI0024687C16|nr:hypothetical protein [Burkholderia pseudomallei]
MSTPKHSHVVTARLPAQRAEEFDRVPGETNAGKIAWLLDQRAMADRIIEQINEAMAAKIGKVVRMLDGGSPGGQADNSGMAKSIATLIEKVDALPGRIGVGQAGGSPQEAMLRKALDGLVSYAIEPYAEEEKKATIAALKKHVAGQSQVLAVTAAVLSVLIDAVLIPSEESADIQDRLKVVRDQFRAIKGK